MVGTVLRAAEIPVRLALGLDIAVEEDGLGAPVARSAAEQRILAAGNEARVVGERAVRRRHRAVVLLEPALHLGKEIALQQVRVGKLRVAERVLGLEVGANFRIECPRIAHDLLPVVRPEPGIVVDELEPVPVGGARTARGNRRLGERMSMSWAVHSTLHAER